ncbi:hypothetical protein HELRODRAFT_165413 [Helobdella robusta]|uniref:Uncharacterized protein n=1 Tax=Helobdella robusta TaxID=6412 RepID=T1EWR0_HELRO|nr:hypothetical protein HELRODRAFT_165413 [Helobdella robusta]ESN91384.1 hypothetical protein HELRODRAFT_165413 [Helobdella robusta]
MASKTSISENKKTWYVLPEEKKDLSLHEALSTKRAIINTINSIKPINDNMLEEKIIDNKHRDESDDNFLDERIKELEAKLRLNDKYKLQDVEKKIFLEKFNKKQNPTEWIEKFENECRRHKILNLTNVIKTLRFFLSGSPEDWYESNLKKIGLTNWSEWRKSFLTIFADRDHIEDENRRKDILNLINKYKHMFVKDKYDVGKVKSKEAEIKLTRDEYVTARPYKCSIVDEEEIKTQVKKLLEADLIEESQTRQKLRKR